MELLGRPPGNFRQYRVWMPRFLVTFFDTMLRDKLSFRKTMKHVQFLLLISTLALATFANVHAIDSFKFTNRIEGIVYDPNNVPVENARVELQDDTNSTLMTTRTSSQGRFTFVGMPPGRYDIKVLPLGTNLVEQTQEAYVTQMSRLSSDMVFVEFHLQYDKRLMASQPSTPPEAIFVQDVPPDARKLYEQALDDVKKHDQGGAAKLEDAIKIFPDYYDALSLLGGIYFEQNAFDKAAPYYLRAVGVNPRSFNVNYNLAFSLYQLRRYPEAVKPAEAAKSLDHSSVVALLLYGSIVRINGDYPNAEAELKKANSLAQGKNADVHMQLALLYNRTNRNQEAVGELKTYLKLEPDSPDKKKIEDLIAKLKMAGENPK